jgi:hypothetical protein
MSSRNSPVGLDFIIHWRIGIWGAADKAVLNKVNIPWFKSSMSYNSNILVSILKNLNNKSAKILDLFWVMNPDEEIDAK